MRGYYDGPNPWNVLIMLFVFGGMVFWWTNVGEKILFSGDQVFTTNQQFSDYAEKIADENTESYGAISDLTTEVTTLEEANAELLERNKFLEETKKPIQVPGFWTNQMFFIIYLGLGFILGRQSTWVKPNDKKAEDESTA